MRLAAKFFMNALVNVGAYIEHFSFPKKFTWQWKWEMLRHCYEKETTRLLAHIVHKDMTVIDAGAHIGYFTRLFSRRVGPEGSVNLYCIAP